MYSARVCACGHDPIPTYVNDGTVIVDLNVCRSSENSFFIFKGTEYSVVHSFNFFILGLNDYLKKRKIQCQ